MSLHFYFRREYIFNGCKLPVFYYYMQQKIIQIVKMSFLLQIFQGKILKFI